MTTVDTRNEAQYLELGNNFKALLREAGYTGQMTVATGENMGEMLVKVIQPNSDGEATLVVNLADSGIEILDSQSKVNRRNTVTTFTIRLADEEPAIVTPDDGRLSDEEAVDWAEEVEEVEADENPAGEVNEYEGGDLPAEAGGDEPELDDEAGEEDQEQLDHSAAENAVKSAEEKAAKADRAPVNKENPAEVAARVADLLEEKRVHAGDKKMQRDIRRRLRALGYYISKVVA